MRPLLVLTPLAAAMVGWFALRMWCGGDADVWRVSCLLGAWAPLGAAVTFQFVADTCDREDSVFAAWLVRAIGMHLVLAWLVGASDWLRGPPSLRPAWNSDLGAPLVLVTFFPAFALCWTAVRWTRRVRARLAARAPERLRTEALPAAPVPYRGAASLRVTRRARALPVDVLAAAAVGASCVALCVAAPLGSVASLALSVAALAAVSSLGAGAVLPALASLAAVGGVLVARGVPATASASLATHHAFAWPWVTLAAALAYLAAVELRLGVQGAAAGTTT